MWACCAIHNLLPVQLPFPFTKRSLPTCVALREGSTKDILHALRHSESARQARGFAGQQGTSGGPSSSTSGAARGIPESLGGASGAEGDRNLNSGRSGTDWTGGELERATRIPPSQAFASFADAYLQSLGSMHRIAVGYGIVSFDVVSRVEYVARLLQQAARMASTPRYAVHVVLFVSDNLQDAVRALEARTIVRFMTTNAGSSASSEAQLSLEHVSGQVCARVCAEPQAGGGGLVVVCKVSPNPGPLALSEPGMGAGGTQRLSMSW